MKMKRSVLLLLVLAVVMLSIVPALTVTAQDSLIESVCLVTDLGSVTDGTFNQFAHEGAVMAEEEFGLDYRFIETQAQTDYDNDWVLRFGADGRCAEFREWYAGRPEDSQP
mgnify:CR=1 FL=1